MASHFSWGDESSKAGNLSPIDEVFTKQLGLEEIGSQSELESISGEATDDEDQGSADSGSGQYSQCRSANFSSSRSWYHSPDNNDFMFGSSDLHGYLNDSGDSGDAFVDALDECFDADKDRDLNAARYYFHSLQDDPLTNDETVLSTLRLSQDQADAHDQLGDTENRDLIAENSQARHLLRLHDDGLADEKIDEAVASSPSFHQVDANKSQDRLHVCFDNEHPVRLEEHLDMDSGSRKSETAVADSVRGFDTRVSHPEEKLEVEGEANTTLQVFQKKKSIMRLGSKEAEDLLQLDVAEIVKPLRLSSMRKAEAGVDLGPDELFRYVETLDVKETYMDTVWDMEEILLDTGETSGRHSFWASNKISPGKSSSTSSSSVYDGLWKVDSVEVIGARQRRGGASLGERVVGIREHTIYRIRVTSGGNEWEIERRYRDFVDLFQQLKRMFNTRSSRVQLPSPWEKVSAESRKLFGNTSPDVVEIRSALLQVCLQSTLQAGVPVSTAAPLLRFLFPSPGETRLPMLTGNSELSLDVSKQQNFYLQLKELGSPKSDSCTSAEMQQDSGSGLTPLGRTIRLVLQIQTRKPLKQQLLNQRNLCAGCYEQLTSLGSLVSGFVNSLGWGKPRYCEYTGQLFCPGCHLNEAAILPARVLQSWDFSPRPVSQLAKAYLDSIYDQPMLCVSAVNPFLYSRVPILAHVSETRKKLNRLMNSIHCPSRSRIQQVLGTRRYLLEQNDFYALRDLADLSKGAFAVLPGLLKATLEKLILHVTRKCSVCLELAEPCGAGVLCDSPSDLIYTFQEDGVHRCQLCNTAHHKRCFKMIETCNVCTRDSPMEVQQPQSSAAAFTQEPDEQSVSSESAFACNSTGLGEQSQQTSGKTMRALFSALFGPQKNLERRDSAVVNMSAISGPVEL